MNQYYLMAQLPSLDGITDAMPLPITEERYFELCGRFLGKRAKKVLDGITLAPPRDRAASGASLVDDWNDEERRLRLALGAIRAQRMQKPFDVGGETLTDALLETARTAADMKDPLAAENYLCQYRLMRLEALRPADMFSEASVFYYGLRLKLLGRMRQYDAARGRLAYQTIYHSVLHGDEEEANNDPE